METEILNQGGPCPVVAREWEYDERDPSSHFFVKDYECQGFFTNSGLKSVHCEKCGLTVKLTK